MTEMSGFPQQLGGGSDARSRPRRHDRDMTRSFLVVSSFNPEDARRAVLASPLETDFAVISLSDPDPETADDLERTVPLP
jgi:hypothetical protein